MIQIIEKGSRLDFLASRSQWEIDSFYLELDSGGWKPQVALTYVSSQDEGQGCHTLEDHASKQGQVLPLEQLIKALDAREVVKC